MVEQFSFVFMPGLLAQQSWVLFSQLWIRQCLAALEACTLLI